MRECTSCGKTYHRVNRLHVWTIRNPGSLLGWLKQDARLCNDCFAPKAAQRVITVANVRLVTEIPKKKQKRRSA